MITNNLRQFDIDRYFGRQLQKRCGLKIFQGVSSFESRRKAIADAMVTHRLANEPINDKGKPETWSHAFDRLYAEPAEAAA